MPYNAEVTLESRWPQELRLAQLYADGLRMRILGECNKREMSPRGYYELIGGGTLARVTEAFELLAQYEWIEPARSEDPAPDAAERLYRGRGAPVVSTQTQEKLPGSTKALIAFRVFESLAERTREAMKAGTICARPDTHLTWMPLELDRQGWEAMIARLDALFFALNEEQERARERLARSGEEPIPATVALLGFESPKDPERKFS